MLSTEIETRVMAEAARRGVQADQLVNELIDAGLPKAADGRPNQASIDILTEWEAETATNDLAEIARRQAEFEDFKKELNQTRLRTEGPHARIPFP